ncbi:MAG: ImmA/IrrE family metallo-endopeptidase [Clostridium sp.]|uniref:ImmA/IrrE family metallo-endopeptidase n=1 Tax=Clostridium sp. TaxID=1506 RepID=UPI00303CF92B
MRGLFYEDLLKVATSLNITVKELSLETRDGFCKGNRIAISKTLSTNAERLCVLAEELGHCLTTVGDITDQTKINNRKQELIARRWGYEKLIGIVDLINAHKHGCTQSYEVADYLDVTESFLEETIEYYRCKYENGYYFGDYWINFNQGLHIYQKF